MTVADGDTLIMPVRAECLSTGGPACPSSASLVPPAPINTFQPGVATSLLYSGSQFRGYQKSKGNSYDVEVVLQHVTVEDSYLCGYLKIKGLTEEYPTLTTFFAGEIISRKRPFLTRKWDADEDVDRKHWGKFQPFYKYAKSFNSDDFDYELLDNSDYVFMRWKEQFLVPDHTIKDISGASFAGFYYICFQKSTANIEGYYYHRSSEWYQSLNLNHVREHSMPIYEFRTLSLSFIMEAQRYPISVGLIGVMHKEKCKMFMTSVLWSDQNEIVVYRTFQDFKTMHKQLKKAFPPANKMKKSDRILPKFQDNKVNAAGQKRGPSKSLLRLKFLQKYCNELLSCDPQVSQSADLIQFFHPKDQDLQPEFAKNSIMIMPSVDDVSPHAGQVQGGNVTQPFVTETYRCVAAYETKDTKNKPFKVVVDENVDVLIKDKAGWWLVENEDKRMAWFPAPYLEKIDDDIDEDEDDINGSSDRGELYTAVKSYKATKDDEITVAIGSVVEVLQKSDNGWWLIRYNGKAGYIPTMYLQPYNYPHIRMTAHHQGHRHSSPNQIPSLTLDQQSNQLSLSQGNLLQLPPLRSSTPSLLPPNRWQKSNSLGNLFDQPPSQPAARPAANVATSPTTANISAPPTIMVEMDGEEERRGMSQRADSEGSLSSNSDLNDELDSSWASSTSFNLSQSYNEEQLRLSRTPPPITGNRLSPAGVTERKMIPSTSDPNLYKGPAAPKVPPRPRAQEILTRCSTVTRKNATKVSLSPTPTEIMSH
ncbi:SH3 and PX domain-containing protein 2B-like [Anoplopoma fimbria]|uniref:SH3 and PX domain-containing protein 2B-like n=1 Tax=Anoplopoma fimbria TaxID=229290 RepID=UPI0023EBA921|nr:SH3 and PX domain-containing protein 2B-like [Anoplopoma fimbria]